MTDTVLITGYFDLDPAKRDDAIAAALACMEATHAEEGNEVYTFSADLGDPGRLWVSEQWASAAALDTHMASAHLAEFMTAVAGCGIKGGALTRWDGATGSKLM
jgi:quinol monooxygenase YgiN